MRKIIIVLSVICALVSLFTISTFAEEVYVIPAGDYTVELNTVPILEGYEIAHNTLNIDFDFVSNGVTYNRLVFSIGSNNALRAHYCNTSTTPVTQHTAQYSNWKTEYKTITVTEDTTLTADEYAWFSNAFPIELEPQPPAEPSECDGTSCPATDFDHDNYCDECEKPLVLSLRSTLYDYAYTQATTLADRLQILSSYTYWLIYVNPNQEGSYIVYWSQQPFYTYEGSNELQSDSTVQREILVTMADGGFGSQGIGTAPRPITFTRSNIVDTSHEINFPSPPLWEEIREVAEGEMHQKTLPALGGAMMIVVVCGISLIAFLVLLVLLSRKWRIFLR